MLASNCCGSQCHVAVAEAIGEAQPLVIHFDAQLDRHAARRSAMGGVNASGRHLIGQRRHHAQMLAGLVARDVEVVELGCCCSSRPGRPSAGSARARTRRRVDGAETVRLLPPRDERLPEQAADRLAAEEPQVARPRAQAEEFVRVRRAQPLKLDRQRVGVEVLPDRRGRDAAAAADPPAPAFRRSGCPRPSSVRSQPSSPHVIF